MTYGFRVLTGLMMEMEKSFFFFRTVKFINQRGEPKKKKNYTSKDKKE